MSTVPRLEGSPGAFQILRPEPTRTLGMAPGGKLTKFVPDGECTMPKQAVKNHSDTLGLHKADLCSVRVWSYPMATGGYNALSTALASLLTLPRTDQELYPRNRGASYTKESLTCQTRKQPLERPVSSLCI
jgi:hypothetical protein